MYQIEMKVSNMFMATDKEQFIKAVSFNGLKKQMKDIRHRMLLTKLLISELIRIHMLNIIQAISL